MILVFGSEKTKSMYDTRHTKKYHPPGINEASHVRMKSTPAQHLLPLPPLPFYIEPDFSEPEEQPNGKESSSEEASWSPTYHQIAVLKQLNIILRTIYGF